MRDAADLAGFAFRRPQSDLRADASKRAIGLDTVKGALPDYYQVPAAISPCRFVAAVAVDVLRPFPHPEGDVRLRHCRVLAPVPVPKTSPHVDYRLRLGDHNVGLAFKPLIAHPEPPTRSEQPFADKKFRLRVLPANLRHQTATLFFAYFVHGSEISSKLCQAGKFGKGKEFIVLIRTNQEMVEKNDSKAPSKII